VKGNYRQDIYAPLCDKTFETAVSNLLSTEFPKIGGPRVIELLVKELKSIVETYYPPITNLRMGQMLWFAVAKDETVGIGKSMEKLRLQPVVLSVITHEDIQKMANGLPIREVRKDAVARILLEADEQDGTLAESDLALIYSCTNGTISKYIIEYEREHDMVLPRRGTVHDLGRSVSHKSDICRKSVVNKKAPPDIARETYHSTEAVDRYLNDFERVQFCLKKGMSVEGTSFATGMSRSLVIEYVDLVNELSEYGDGNVNQVS
jgi:hypothetical protein